MPFKLFIVLFAALLITIACNSAEEENADALKFQVDSALLEKARALDPYQIIFRAPKNWKKIDKVLFDSLRARVAMEREEMGFSLVPLEIYSKQENEAMLSVSEIRIPSDKDAVLDTYYSQLENAFPGFEVKQGIFTSGGLFFRQYLIYSTDRVMFKLITHKDTTDTHYLQFDYIIPREHYGNEIKAIESSIGSIISTH